MQCCCRPPSLIIYCRSLPNFPPFHHCKPLKDILRGAIQLDRDYISSTIITFDLNNHGSAPPPRAQVNFKWRKLRRDSPKWFPADNLLQRYPLPSILELLQKLHWPTSAREQLTLSRMSPKLYVFPFMMHNTER